MTKLPCRYLHEIGSYKYDAVIDYFYVYICLALAPHLIRKKKTTDVRRCIVRISRNFIY